MLGFYNTRSVNLFQFSSAFTIATLLFCLLANWNIKCYVYWKNITLSPVFKWKSRAFDPILQAFFSGLQFPCCHMLPVWAYVVYWYCICHTSITINNGWVLKQYKYCVYLSSVPHKMQYLLVCLHRQEQLYFLLKKTNSLSWTYIITTPPIYQFQTSFSLKWVVLKCLRHWRISWQKSHTCTCHCFNWTSRWKIDETYINPVYTWYI